VDANKHIRDNHGFTLSYSCETEGCNGEVVTNTITESVREHLYGERSWPCHCVSCGTLYVSNLPLPLTRSGYRSLVEFEKIKHVAHSSLVVIKMNTER